MNKVAIEIAAPPALTVLCLVLSGHLPGVERAKVRPRTWVQFWMLLISAYAMLAIALWGHNFLGNHNMEVDPSLQLVR